MEEILELNEDFQLDFHSVSAKQGHFGSSTEYVAARHRVIYRTWGARRRCFGLLPPKVLPEKVERLDLPETVTTREEIWEYVRQHRPYWIRTSPRRRGR